MAIHSVRDPRPGAAGGAWAAAGARGGQEGRGTGCRPAAAAPGRSAAAAAAAPAAEKEFHCFAFTTDPAYDLVEKIALWVVLVIAIAGLVYALGLVNQVVGADEGTERMREVGAAIRQGANAYLARQFKAIAPLMVVLTGLLWATAEVDASRWRSAGRLLFSWERHSPGWSGSSG